MAHRVIFFSSFASLLWNVNPTNTHQTHANTHNKHKAKNHRIHYFHSIMFAVLPQYIEYTRITLILPLLLPPIMLFSKKKEKKFHTTMDLSWMNWSWNFFGYTTEISTRTNRKMLIVFWVNRVFHIIILLLFAIQHVWSILACQTFKQKKNRKKT